MRHKRWGIDLDWFKDKVCLDAGCGGGRFVVALARLGAKKVAGIDISAPAIEAAKERIRTRRLEDRVELQVASVLNIPYPDANFDYVVSSGVIHHTPNPKRGFQELVRVLKPGGKLFLSVYGRGGLVWMINDLGRLIAKIVPFKVMEKLWAAIGIPANKRYNYLDNMYVPYCYRFTEKEMRQWLESAGFENIRRMKFERYDYEKPWSRFMHGEGWLHFYADKK
jgi:ubiquinone/menaquinone biosynthesis C-methylase UbiE